MLRLEVFELDGAGPERGYLDPKSAEKLRSQGYEDGYAAGWQDCAVHAADASAAQLAAAVDALQRLSFTYAEARALAEQQLVQLTETLLRRLLPSAIEAGLPLRVGQELSLLLGRDPQARLVLRCAPATASAMAQVLNKLPVGAQIALEEEPAFSPAQVVVSGHDQKRRIDFDCLLELLALDMREPSDAILQVNKGRT